MANIWKLISMKTNWWPFLKQLFIHRLCPIARNNVTWWNISMQILGVTPDWRGSLQEIHGQNERIMHVAGCGDGLEPRFPPTPAMSRSNFHHSPLQSGLTINILTQRSEPCQLSDSQVLEKWCVYETSWRCWWIPFAVFKHPVKLSGTVAFCVCLLLVPVSSRAF